MYTHIQLKNDTGCLSSLPRMSRRLFKPYKKPIVTVQPMVDDAWLMHENIALFHWQTVWNIANIILTEKNNNIWSVANQFLKDSFHFSNGCAFRKPIISFGSADGNTANLNFVGFFCSLSMRFTWQLHRNIAGIWVSVWWAFDSFLLCFYGAVIQHVSRVLRVAVGGSYVPALTGWLELPINKSGTKLLFCKSKVHLKSSPMSYFEFWVLSFNWFTELLSCLAKVS